MGEHVLVGAVESELDDRGFLRSTAHQRFLLTFTMTTMHFLLCQNSPLLHRDNLRL